MEREIALTQKPRLDYDNYEERDKHHEYKEYDKHQYSSNGHNDKQKKRGFLSDLFDF
jgi:Zn-finger nucleic acid-binding protein